MADEIVAQNFQTIRVQDAYAGFEINGVSELKDGDLDAVCKILRTIHAQTLIMDAALDEGDAGPLNPAIIQSGLGGIAYLAAIASQRLNQAQEAKSISGRGAR